MLHRRTRHISHSDCGGSAIYGFGQPITGSAPWRLERVLQRMRPAQSWEVLNVGRKGVASNVEREIVKAALPALKPDLVIAQIGNNEFLPMELYRSRIPGYDSRAERIRRILSRSSLYSVPNGGLGRPRQGRSGRSVARFQGRRRRNDRRWGRSPRGRHIRPELDRDLRHVPRGRCAIGPVHGADQPLGPLGIRENHDIIPMPDDVRVEWDRASQMRAAHECAEAVPILRHLLAVTTNTRRYTTTSAWP